MCVNRYLSICKKFSVKKIEHDYNCISAIVVFWKVLYIIDEEEWKKNYLSYLRVCWKLDDRYFNWWIYKVVLNWHDFMFLLHLLFSLDNEFAKQFCTVLCWGLVFISISLIRYFEMTSKSRKINDDFYCNRSHRQTHNQLRFTLSIFFYFKQSTNENFGVKQAELVLAEDFCSK